MGGNKEDMEGKVVGMAGTGLPAFASAEILFFFIRLLHRRAQTEWTRLGSAPAGSALLRGSAPRIQWTAPYC